MIPTVEDIICITQNVMSTMMSLEAQVEDKLEHPTSEKMTGCIQISGAWHGAVVIETTETLTRAVAERMLMIPQSELQDTDLTDVLAELTNMIGGNIKSQVQGPSTLALPSVTTGAEFQFKLKGVKVVSSVPMSCNDEPLNIILCEAAETA